MLYKNAKLYVVKGFLTLKDFEEKSGEDIPEAICELQKEKNINLINCCGQASENGSNMQNMQNRCSIKMLFQKNFEIFTGKQLCQCLQALHLF